jgi:hypothetical protein
MQADAEPSQLVPADEAGGRMYQAKQRVGPERQTQAHKLATP